MDSTLEAIYLLNEVFYVYPDRDEWPESAKLFYKRACALLGGLIVEGKLTPEQVKKVLEETRR